MQLGWTSSASSQSSKKTISFLKTSQFFVHQIPDFQPPTKRPTDLKRVKAIPNDIQLPEAMMARWPAQLLGQNTEKLRCEEATLQKNSRGTEKKKQNLEDWELQNGL